MVAYILNIKSNKRMNKIVLFFFFISFVVNPIFGRALLQGNDTICYHYYADSERSNGVRIPCMYDEILVVINNGNGTECMYYGPSLEFDDSPEPFLPGFITLDATDFLMKNGKVSFKLNPTGRNYYSQPIELNLRTDEDIQNAGYRLWLQFPEFFWMDVMFEGVYDNNTISIRNKTLYPEKMKVFHKEPLHDTMNTYKRNLIEAELERENNINYRNQSGM